MSSVHQTTRGPARINSALIVSQSHINAMSAVSWVRVYQSMRSSSSAVSTWRTRAALHGPRRSCPTRRSASASTPCRGEAIIPRRCGGNTILICGVSPRLRPSHRTFSETNRTRPPSPPPPRWLRAAGAARHAMRRLRNEARVETRAVFTEGEEGGIPTAPASFGWREGGARPSGACVLRLRLIEPHVARGQTVQEALARIGYIRRRST